MSPEAGAKPAIDQPPGQPGRILVVAGVPLVGEDTLERVVATADDGDATFLVIAPALTDSAFEHVMGSVDDAIAQAQERLDRSLGAMRDRGLDVEGRVGDSDPLLAIEDALREFEAGSVVLVTATDDDARWLEDDLFERAKQRVKQPIIHLTVEGEGAERHVADVEIDDEGVEEPRDGQIESESRNLPSFSARDIGGILVALVGTFVAIVIAAGCDGGETLQRTGPEAGEGTDGSCVAAHIVAGATALVNAAHIIGLVFFQSVGYRGPWERFLSVSSLIGTPLAVVAVILLAH